MNEEQQQPKAGVDLGRIRAAIEPVLSAHGVTLVELDWLTERTGWTLRLTIEREEAAAAEPGSAISEAGVTLQDCSEVSRDVSAVLDVEDLIAPKYHLEVSSPGLDRPLRTPREFARFTGKLARVKLGRPAPDGQTLLRGRLEAAPEGSVAVLCDGKRIEVPFTDIVEANLVFELVTQAKPGQPKKGPKTAKSKPRGSAQTKQKQGRK